MFSFEELLDHAIFTVLESAGSKKSLIKILKASQVSVPSPESCESFLKSKGLSVGPDINWITMLNSTLYKEFTHNAVFAHTDADATARAQRLVKFTPLGQVEDSKLIDLLSYLDQLIAGDKVLMSNRQYLVIQIAKGHIKIHLLQEDIGKISETIRDFANYSKRSYWTASKNLYEYDNIHDLMREVNKHRERAKYEDESKNLTDSIILYKSSYKTNNQNEIEVAELLGMPAPTPVTTIRTYWFRRVLTMDGCIEYGKGTAWCTSASRGVEGVVKTHVSDGYLPRGVFQVERQVSQIVDGKEEIIQNRTPVLQFTPSKSPNKNQYFQEMKSSSDTESIPRATLRQFLVECANKLRDILSQDGVPEEKEYKSRPNFSYKANDRQLYSNIVKGFELMLGQQKS